MHNVKPKAQISAFVFATKILQCLLFFNPKLQACFCDFMGWFVSDLVGNPNCWFSHAKAHISMYLYERLLTSHKLAFKQERKTYRLEFHVTSECTCSNGFIGVSQRYSWDIYLINQIYRTFCLLGEVLLSSIIYRSTSPYAHERHIIK